MGMEAYRDPVDGELWRAADTDPEAFGELFGRHARSVFVAALAAIMEIAWRSAVPKRAADCDGSLAAWPGCLGSAAATCPPGVAWTRCRSC